MKRLNLGQAMRNAKLFLVVIGLLLNSLPVSAQTNRRAARPATTTATPKKNVQTGASSQEAHGGAQLLRSRESRVMSEAFTSGKLPDPLRVPSGKVDHQAAELAKAVSARDESSTAALYAAILAAGFGVRGTDESILQTVQPGQGLLFDAWEIAAMAKMYGEARSAPLGYLTEGLRSIPDLKDVPLNDLLLEGIRTRAEGRDPVMRFWARFIVELGRQQENSYDILSVSDVEKVNLDAVQSALILRRLVGDAYAAGNKTGRTSSRNLWHAPSFRNATFDGGLSLAPAVGSSSKQLFGLQSSLRPPSKWSSVGKPCEGLGGDPVQDVLATELTNVWSNLFGDTRVGRAVGIANVVLAYAKFLATYAALETEISVANPPVVRTRNAAPDRAGRRQLTAKVTMNVGKWDQINCFRSALNILTGLDFNLLDDGPLEGVEVVWHLDQGGAGSMYSNRTGITGNRQFVGFVNDGPRIQDAGTYAGIPGRGGIPVGNLTRGKTDKEGTARVFLEGSPKVPSVSAPFVPVMKQAVVRTTIRMKAGDVKGDAADLWGQLRGGLAGLITMPLELLYRTDWASTASLVVPVRDHEECEGGWDGTITMSEEYWLPPSGIIHVNGHSYSETFVIKASKGVATGTFKGQFREEGRGPGANSCTQFRRVTKLGTAEREAKFSVVMIDGSDDYKVFVTSPSIPAKVDHEVSACGYGNREDRAWSETTTAGGFSTSVEGKLDPKNPGVLSGTKEVPGTHGSRKITWELRRCQ